jgi:hypothetical protein
MIKWLKRWIVCSWRGHKETLRDRYWGFYLEGKCIGEPCRRCGTVIEEKCCTPEPAPWSRPPRGHVLSYAHGMSHPMEHTWRPECVCDPRLMSGVWFHFKPSRPRAKEIPPGADCTPHRVRNGWTAT